MSYVPREQLLQLVQFHVSGLLIQKNPTRLLLIKRAKDRALFPDTWSICGGQVISTETLFESIVRHYKEELALDVWPISSFLSTYNIKLKNNEYINGVRFLLQLNKEAEPKLSSTVSEYCWVTPKEFDEMAIESFIPGLYSQIHDLLWLLEIEAQYV